MLDVENRSTTVVSRRDLIYRQLHVRTCTSKFIGTGPFIYPHLSDTMFLHSATLGQANFVSIF